MTRIYGAQSLIDALSLQDEPDDVDEDDDDDDLDDDDDDEDDEEDEEDVETWQVGQDPLIPLKDGWRLTSGTEVPRLAPICQLS